MNNNIICQILPTHRLQAAESEANRTDTGTEDTESGPIDPPAVKAARDWLDIDDEDQPSGSPKDIAEIVKACFKELKKIKTGRTVKMLTQLMAVAEYVKLRTQYQRQQSCTKPCLNASLAIARRMGKGAYFAHRIRFNERYLLQHQQLPPSKSGARCHTVKLFHSKNMSFEPFLLHF
jgi:hypothetical protein